MVFLKNKIRINKNNYRTKNFMSKCVSVPKICLILEEMKLDPKSNNLYPLFTRKPLINIVFSGPYHFPKSFFFFKYKLSTVTSSVMQELFATVCCSIKIAILPPEKGLEFPEGGGRGFYKNKKKAINAI